MPGSRRPLAPLLGVALAGAALWAQRPLGTLLYATAAGRAISLTVVDGGHPAMITLKPDQGDSERFRLFVLQHSGPEAMAAKGAQLLAGRAPAGWKAGPRGPGALLQGDGVVYWRYTPGLVLPARFTFDRQAWSLMTAEVPPRMLVAN